MIKIERIVYRRGGSWNYYDYYCRVNNEYNNNANNSYSDLGFRMCRRML